MNRNVGPPWKDQIPFLFLLSLTREPLDRAWLQPMASIGGTGEEPLDDAGEEPLDGAGAHTLAGAGGQAPAVRAATPLGGALAHALAGAGSKALGGVGGVRP